MNGIMPDLLSSRVISVEYKVYCKYNATCALYCRLLVSFGFPSRVGFCQSWYISVLFYYILQLHVAAAISQLLRLPVVQPWLQAEDRQSIRLPVVQPWLQEEEDHQS
jgi:hypothetical protein